MEVTPWVDLKSVVLLDLPELSPRLQAVLRCSLTPDTAVPPSENFR